MKRLLLAAGLIAMAGLSAFAQVSENKTPVRKKAVRVPAKVQSGSASPASKASLNPQPLPPKPGDPMSAASKVSLNPQPLPPKQKIGSATAESKVALNPQPLPPKTKTKAGVAASPGSKVSLNPQPLPPKVAAPAAAGQAKQ
jgi:hypothetical protein